MIQKDLQNHLQGDVRFDLVSRLLYATSASNYQIVPLGVVLPKTEEDVSRTVEIASSHNIPLVPRGGGTSLAGQTVGQGLVVDFSRYMNGVLELNLDQGWVKVQPGIVLDALNDFLAPYGVFWPIDTATSNRAVIGGQIGNNSCGARSIRYGKTVHQVVSLDCLLGSGEKLTLGIRKSTTPHHGKTEEIQQKIDLLIRENLAEIQERYPKILRNAGGYNLDEMAKKDAGLAPLIIGSEGTLAVVTSATLKLIALPKHRHLFVASFPSLHQALSALPFLVDSFSPTAVELLDGVLLGLARRSPSFSRYVSFLPGEPQGVLIVEFSEDSEALIKRAMDELEKWLKSFDPQCHSIQAFDKKLKHNIWKLRKSGLPLLLSGPGSLKPQTCIEDTAVPLDRLGEYVKRFQALLKKYGTHASFYGHGSVGCLHIRPFLNLKEPSGLYTMEALLEEVLELVMEFDGSFSGEHGDGLQRSALLKKFYGPKLHRAFCQIKEIFDPSNLMNPGKIVNSPSPLASLRYGTQYKTIQVNTGLDFSAEGSFEEAVELCNGAGVCRKKKIGVMCPSYRATLEEKHSTRGRANLLRWALRKDSPHISLTSPELYEALDLCLMCKACKSECPSSVDMAKIKEEFLFHYHKKHPRKGSDYFFAFLPLLSRMGSLVPGLSNRLIQSPLTKKILSLLGLTSSVEFPTLANTTFYSWWKQRQKKISTSSKKILLFADTFTNYYSPQIGVDGVKILERLGYQIQVIPHGCCGRPLLSKGFLNRAKRLARKNIDLLFPWVQKGYKICSLEPSCLLTLRDYPSLVPSSEARELAEQTFLIQEIIAKEKDLPFTKPSQKVVYHGHCHEKSALSHDPVESIFRSIPHLKYQMIESTCCGMAGSFGMEKAHSPLSLKIGNLSLFPAIKDHPNCAVVTCGISCRQQIKRGTAREALHLVEFLSQLLD